MSHRMTGWLLACCLSIQLVFSSSLQTAQAQATSIPAQPSAVTRASVLQRAQAWVSLHVPYSQKSAYSYTQGLFHIANHPNIAAYRTDCSGFVSMAYQLPTEAANGAFFGGPITSQLSQYFHPITKAQLLPGDILFLSKTNAHDGHVVIFAGWASAQQNRYIGLEEFGGKSINGHPTSGTIQRNIAYPYDTRSKGSGDYIPMRYNGFGAQATGQIPLSAFSAGTFMPIAMTSGPDGNLWFTALQLSSDQSQPDKALVGCLTPRGTICLNAQRKPKEFPIADNEFPLGITSGSDGNIWFTESGDFNNAGNSIGQIGRITPQGQLSEFPILITNSDPIMITNGLDGNLWFTDDGTGKIGRITPGRNPQASLVEFSVPSPSGSRGSLLGITSGPDGNLWFTQTVFSGVNGTTTSGQIGRITPSADPAKSIRLFNVPTAGSIPAMITSGPDDNLWFTESIDKGIDNGADRLIGAIGRVTPQGQIHEFPIPNSDFHTQGGGGFLYGIQSGPEAIATGPDGNLWFTNSDPAHHNLIGRLVVSNDAIQFPFSQVNGSYGIASSPDGNLWFTGFSASQSSFTGLLGQIAFRH